MPLRQYPLLPSKSERLESSCSKSVESTSLEHLEGSIERVVYHNPESSYCVLKIRVPGKKRMTTLVGFAASASPGEKISAEGHFKVHPDFGTRFEAERLRTLVPETEALAEKFLSSGFVRGIGPEIARKMVDTFGAKIFDVIEQAPELLRDVPGIGASRSRQIQQAWSDNKAVRTIMDFMHSHGLNALKAVRIYKTLGPQAVEIIEKNPYIMAREVHGLGFKSSDAVAKHLGIAADSEMRIDAGITEAMHEALKDGHCAVPLDKLANRASRILDVSRELCLQAIARAIDEKTLILAELEGVRCVYWKRMYDSEVRVAERVAMQLQGLPPWGTLDPENALKWLDQTSDFPLAPSQREAFTKVLDSRVSIITGGPGSGKTTLLREVARYFHAIGLSFELVAPTGRAARRLSETTGFTAKTIHRALGFDPATGGFLYKEGRTLPIELLVIDEASMLDLELMDSVLSAIHEDAALILIGDVDQIPAVRAGEVLRALVQSEKVPVCRLSELFRQVEGGGINRAARAINEGLLPKALQSRPASRGSPEELKDFYFIRAGTADEAIATIRKLVVERVPERFNLDPRTQVQVLCPMNRGPVGSRVLNNVLQESLNSSAFLKVARFGTTFSLGDKVLMTVNDYERDLFNGDIGFVTDIDKTNGTLTAEFDGFPKQFDFSDLDLLQLAYAMSVHKAQGSEYDAVIVPIMHEHDPMLRRNLLYTAVTRARKLVVLVGQESALRQAIKQTRQAGRVSGLATRLREAVRARHAS